MRSVVKHGFTASVSIKSIDGSGSTYLPTLKYQLKHMKLKALDWHSAYPLMEENCYKICL